MIDGCSIEEKAIDDSRRRLRHHLSKRAKVSFLFLLIIILILLPHFALCAVYGYIDEKGEYRFTNKIPVGKKFRIIIPDKEAIRKDKSRTSPKENGSDVTISSFNWPPWIGPRPAMPKATKGKGFIPADLFQVSSVSVYAVIATSNQDTIDDEESNTAIGSAVAISSRQLVTNCRIVNTRPIIYVKQGDVRDRARLLYAQADTDRCYLQIEKIKVNPVRGVRSYNDLVVGERVYSIGAPAGLENTLGEGLISGLRSKGIALFQKVITVQIMHCHELSPVVCNRTIPVSEDWPL